MSRAIICFQGFTEDDSSATGTEDLYFKVIRTFSSRGVTTYQPRRWNSDLKSLLGQLRRQHIQEVIIVAYSWGAGYTAQKFAKEAPEYGISIPLMLLCDPVYRPLWLPAWLGANPLCVRSLCKNSKITIPRSVSYVAWVRQNLNLPAGHDLVPQMETTHISPAITLRYTHTNIDQSPEWFDLVKREISNKLHK